MFWHFFMRCNRVTTWLILTYLVLLVNLGPSLHRAELFGLHGHSSIQSDDVVAPTCCSCHHHFSRENSSPDGEVPVVASNHDCAFCKFFDQYTVVFHAFQFAQFKEPIHLPCFENLPSKVSYSVPTVARGPPVA